MASYSGILTALNIDARPEIMLAQAMEMGPIIRLQRVDSTNEYLKQHRELWGEKYCTVCADEQTGGRGRLGRRWHSEAGRDLTFSTLFHPMRLDDSTACVSLYAGLAVHRALRVHITEGLWIKWPNDICYEEKKLGGILCESLIGEGPLVIIGIGINVNGTGFPDEIKNRAASMKMITGREYGSEMIMAGILSELEALLEAFAFPVPEPILREWKSHSRSFDQTVLYEGGNSRRRGRIVELRGDGLLVIRDEETQSDLVYAGEIFFTDEKNTDL